MTKEELNFILKYNNYIKGGTKEASLKVKDFVKKIQYVESNSSIEFKEFLECIGTLLAFTFSSKDTIPERWYCDNDCRYNSCMICPGEFNTEEKSEKICPYYKQENI